MKELLQKFKVMAGLSTDDPPDTQWIKLEKTDRKSGKKVNILCRLPVDEIAQHATFHSDFVFAGRIFRPSCVHGGVVDSCKFLSESCCIYVPVRAAFSTRSGNKESILLAEADMWSTSERIGLVNGEG